MAYRSLVGTYGAPRRRWRVPLIMGGGASARIPGLRSGEEPTVPTYQYQCTECGEPLEAQQSFSDPSLTECPACGGHLRKVFNAVGVVFKGSGFYRNDSRAPEKTSEQKGSDKKSESTTASESSSGSKSDSKPSSDSGSSTKATTSASA